MTASQQRREIIQVVDLRHASFGICNRLLVSLQPNTSVLVAAVLFNSRFFTTAAAEFGSPHYCGVSATEWMMLTQ